jgi:hypothetical protein
MIACVQYVDDLKKFCFTNIQHNSFHTSYLIPEVVKNTFFKTLKKLLIQNPFLLLILSNKRIGLKISFLNVPCFQKLRQSGGATYISSNKCPGSVA